MTSWIYREREVGGPAELEGPSFTHHLREFLSRLCYSLFVVTVHYKDQTLYRKEVRGHIQH